MQLQGTMPFTARMHVICEAALHACHGLYKHQDSVQARQWKFHAAHMLICQHEDNAVLEHL